MTCTNTLSSDWIEALEERGFDTSDNNTELLQAMVSIAEDYGVEPNDFCDFYQGEAEGYSAKDAGASFSQQLAEECGQCDGLHWPATCIDWQAAWRELELGDGFAVHQVPGQPCIWWVTRSI